MIEESIKEIIIEELRALIYYPKCPDCKGRCTNKGVEKLTEEDWEKVCSFVNEDCEKDYSFEEDWKKVFPFEKEKFKKDPSDEICERDRLRGEFECLKCGKIFRVEIIPKYF